MSKLRVSAKFFALGLIVGLLFAPQSGRELREQLRKRLLL
jgi:hypothetical protein